MLTGSGLLPCNSPKGRHATSRVTPYANRSGRRQHHRHHHRVVRLLPLRHRGGPGLSRLCSFPTPIPSSAQILAFSTFTVGFLARPLGGVIFGYMGDRVGRKSALVATLLLMGVSTSLIGFLPTYARDRRRGAAPADAAAFPARPRRRRRMGRRGAAGPGIRPHAAGAASTRAGRRPACRSGCSPPPA